MSADGTKRWKTFDELERHCRKVRGPHVRDVVPFSLHPLHLFRYAEITDGPTSSELADSLLAAGDERPAVTFVLNEPVDFIRLEQSPNLTVRVSYLRRWDLSLTRQLLFRAFFTHGDFVPAGMQGWLFGYYEEETRHGFVMFVSTELPP